MASKKMTGYKGGGEKLFKALAGKMGKDKSMGILQTMAMGGESIDLVEMSNSMKPMAKGGMEYYGKGGMTYGKKKS
jgi:hypothetical protein